MSNATYSSSHASAMSVRQPRDDGERNTDFQDLLRRARGGETDAVGCMLQWYTQYLTILASTQLDHRLRRRVNPSDVVQEAMLAAHRDFAAFRGGSRPEFLGWLRQILIHTLHRTFKRHVKAGKRDVRRELSLDQVSHQLEQSAGNLATLLPGRVESPSAPMRARERSVALANQLNRLRPQYRDVIVYRVVQGLSFEQVAERMHRSSGAVRMLWLRALEALKTQGDLHQDA